MSRAGHLDPGVTLRLPFGVIPEDFSRHGWSATSEEHAVKGRAHCMDARCAIIQMLLIASCQSAFAQSHAASNESAGKASKPTHMLVLVDGQVITGQVTPRPDGYDVQVAGGRIYIDSDRVRFEATNLPDAYDRMRDSMPDLTPTNHMELARWCLENKLYTQTRREILDALHLDPNREDAKRMLRALEHVGERSDFQKPGSGLTEYPSLAKISRPAIESRSLAGLSRSVAHSFVRDVQPLMMNKCANSGCHGIGTKSQFQLTSTHRGSTPAVAERNLAAVLKQIDFSEPSASPLLSIGGQAHGNMAASAFPGRSGATQMQMLQDWVLQAAHDIAPRAVAIVPRDVAQTSRQDSPKNRSAISGILQVSATVDDSSKSNAVRAMLDSAENPHARKLTTDETDGRFLKEAEYANRQDAFAPEEFNRRYHGSSNRHGSTQSTAAQQLDSSDNKFTDAQIP